MLVGYRVGFLARPMGYGDPHYYYQSEHKNDQYNNREDGHIECSIADSVNYITV
jgi:hypothetical protein